MTKLQRIQNTVEEIAEAISAIMGIETKIIDEELNVVAESGKRKERVGKETKQKKKKSELIYKEILETGENYVPIEEGLTSPYEAEEEELIEICHPIILEKQTIGLIALGGFNNEQRKMFLKNNYNQMLFLKKMANLMASRVSEIEVIHRSRNIAVSNHEGIFDIDERISFNTTAEKQQTFSFDDILGESLKIKETINRAKMIAGNNSTVLITGESGTGKELFARAIHHTSNRKKGPFITVNCGAIPENLLESELFGYERGAFTGAKKTGKVGKFELANNGTVFLDEIGDLSLHLQVKLLHALQRREIERVGGNRVISIDVRVIAATNRDLTQMMYDGEFREDLYFRLCVIPLHVPSLRERIGDVELLLRAFLKKFNQLMAKNILGFNEDALFLLTNYYWPGNVRELENAVEYAVNFEDGPMISMKSMPPRIKQVVEKTKKNISLKLQVDCFQKSLIEQCLRNTGYSVEGKKKAAKLLEISESTLYRRIKELNIEDEEE